MWTHRYHILLRGERTGEGVADHQKDADQTGRVGGKLNRWQETHKLKVLCGKSDAVRAKIKPVNVRSEEAVFLHELKRYIFGLKASLTMLLVPQNVSVHSNKENASCVCLD